MFAAPGPQCLASYSPCLSHHGMGWKPTAHWLEAPGVFSESVKRSEWAQLSLPRPSGVGGDCAVTLISILHMCTEDWWLPSPCLQEGRGV